MRVGQLTYHPVRVEHLIGDESAVLRPYQEGANHLVEVLVHRTGAVVVTVLDQNHLHIIPHGAYWIDADPNAWFMHQNRPTWVDLEHHDRGETHDLALVIPVDRILDAGQTIHIATEQVGILIAQEALEIVKGRCRGEEAEGDRGPGVGRDEAAGDLGDHERADAAAGRR